MKNYWHLYNWMKSHWHLYRFLVKRNLYYVLSLLPIIVGVLTYLAYPSPVLILLSFLISLIISISLLLYDFHQHMRKEFNFYCIPTKPFSLPEIKLDDKYRKSGYDFICFDKDVAVYSPTINRNLLNAQLKFIFSKERFKIPPEASECAPFILLEKFRTGGYCFNDGKIRLCSDLLDKNSGPQQLQHTDYFSGECTNEVALMDIGSITSYNIVLSGPELWINNKILTNFRISQCANYIGVSTLAVTSDRQLVILLQSGGSAQSRWRLAPSGSGSVEPEDIEKVNEDFIKLVVEAMERELLEECGLLQKGLPNYDEYIAKTRIIGFARILNRGGKPEFFGFSVLKKSSLDLKISPRERPFMACIDPRSVQLDTLEDFESYLEGLIKENGPRRLSFSLYLNMMFLIEYLRNNPDDFKQIIKLLE